MTADNKTVRLERYLSHRLLFDVGKGYSFKMDNKALILSYHLDLATGVESDVYLAYCRYMAGMNTSII